MLKEPTKQAAFMLKILKTCRTDLKKSGMLQKKSWRDYRQSKKRIQSEMTVSVHKIFDIVADLYIFI